MGFAHLECAWRVSQHSNSTSHHSLEEKKKVQDHNLSTGFGIQQPSTRSHWLKENLNSTKPVLNVAKPHWLLLDWSRIYLSKPKVRLACVWRAFSALPQSRQLGPLTQAIWILEMCRHLGVSEFCLLLFLGADYGRRQILSLDFFWGGGDTVSADVHKKKPVPEQWRHQKS